MEEIATKGLISSEIVYFYSSLLSAPRKMMLVAPIVNKHPSSMTRRSRGESSTLSTKVPVLLLLSCNL